MLETAETQTTIEAAAPAGPVLDLTVPRVISMRFGAHTYTWKFRRILREDWERLFRSFETETTYILGESAETMETVTGMVEMARSCVTAVDGYQLPAHSNHNPELFRDKLPLGHLKAYASVLRDVRQSPPADDAPIALTDLNEVLLDCTWSAGEDGTMRRWSGLVHRFRPPTPEQQRKFNRACATFRIKGNDRGNTTIVPARQAHMMDFYDELIESVDDCYRAHGLRLGDAQAIAAAMDCCHKVAAVQGLLNAGGVGSIVEPKKEGGIA